jgi:hypothetical protein
MVVFYQLFVGALSSYLQSQGVSQASNMQHDIPEDRLLQSQCNQNLKFHTMEAQITVFARRESATAEMHNATKQIATNCSTAKNSASQCILRHSSLDLSDILYEGG